jgi:hypothetical protein
MRRVFSAPRSLKALTTLVKYRSSQARQRTGQSSTNNRGISASRNREFRMVGDPHQGQFIVFQGSKVKLLFCV